jgi:hypothetical protein
MSVAVIARYTDANGAYLKTETLTFNEYRLEVAGLFYNGWEMLPPQMTEIACMMNSERRKETVSYSLINSSGNYVS